MSGKPFGLSRLIQSPIRRNGSTALSNINFAYEVDTATMTITTTNAPSVQALIMAGGRGERLQPLTASRPKPAVPFGGVFRIVDFTLFNCLNSGLSHVSLLTQYKHEVLQTYIQKSWSGLWTEMTREPLLCLPPSRGNRYRGTADAVFQNVAALPPHGPDFVLILSADHVYQMDYRELLRYHAETNADLTIATVEHSLTEAKQCGVIEVDSEHRVIGFQEKPSNPRSAPSHPASALVSMGIYAFKRNSLLQALGKRCDNQDRYDFGHHIIPSLVGSAHVRAYDFRDQTRDLPGYWRDIGTLDSYYETSMDLARSEASFASYAEDRWPSYPRLDRPPHVSACLNSNCRVTRSILSPGVSIESGSLIES
jgi:glucose-1-phosphate adenylyltransferase